MLAINDRMLSQMGMVAIMGMLAINDRLLSRMGMLAISDHRFPFNLHRTEITRATKERVHQRNHHLDFIFEIRVSAPTKVN